MSDHSPYLDLSIPEARREEWSRELAAVPEATGRASFEKYYVIRLGSEWLGLPPVILATTQAVTRPRRLPHRSRSLVEGLVNWDGRIIVCLDAERVLGVLGGGGEREFARTLVIQWKGWLAAIRVREVLGVEEIDMANRQELPQTSSETIRRSARGVVKYKERSITCLEGEAFVEQLRLAVR